MRRVSGESGSHIISCFSAWAKFLFDYLRFFPAWGATQPGLKILIRFYQTRLGFSAQAELHPGQNPSPCNGQFDFKRICFRSRAEILSVIRPKNTLFQERVFHCDRTDTTQIKSIRTVAFSFESRAFYFGQFFCCRSFLHCYGCCKVFGVCWCNLYWSGCRLFVFCSFL